ncbi:MAG: TetR/AcrR family transcriptional regulator [Coriobacteriia bacterium]
MEATSDRQIGAFRDTRQQILDVARHLFSDCSYLGVSMKDIAQRLGITKAALYYHFSSKRDIYVTVLDEVLVDLRARLCADRPDETAEEQLRRMVKDYLEFGVRERNLVNALMLKLSPPETELRQFVVSSREQLIELFRPAIENVFALRRSLPRADGRPLATMLIAMMDGLVLEHSFFEKALDPDRISGQIVSVLGLDAAPSVSA